MNRAKKVKRLWVIPFVLLCVIWAAGNVRADQAADLVALANNIQNQSPGVNFTISTEKFAYNLSEPVYFTFTADRDCYVAIVDIGTSGKMTLLFPNKWHPNNKIEKGKTYRIPPENSDFVYRVTGPTGQEHIKVIASVDQVMSHVASLQQEVKHPIEPSGASFLVMKNPELVLKDISVAFSGIDSSKWATGGLSFEVVQGASASPPQVPAPRASGQFMGR
ncbi:MAG TPA: DUF4384 domain-containing protein [Desulfomonilaceae bacterium]|nr:DUF4384 domain-containing protein [Desulfomonilaceae bacterium]